MTEAAGAEESAENTQNYSSEVETIDDVTRKATVTIPVSRVNDEFDSALTRYQSTAKLKGFRPGKAPKEIIKKMHGQRLRMDVANKLISETLQEVIKGIEGQVVGNPEIDLSSFEPEEDITFTANLSLFPNPEISGYDSCDISVPKREVGDEDIERVLENLMSSKADQKPIEDRKVAEKGDVVDATLKEAGAADDAPTEPLVIAIGEGHLPEALDNGILGMEVGQTKSIEISHAADSGCESGEEEHTHSFEVTLNSISEKILPELTDEFVKTLQFDGIETALELKTDIRKRLEEEQQQMSNDDVDSEIMKVLLDGNEFLVPKILIEDEIRSLVARAGKIDPSKLDVSTFDVEPFRDEYGDAAERRVRMTIIVDRIAEKEDLKAKEEDLQEHLETVAGQHNLPVEEVRKYFMDQSRAMGTFLEVTRNKVLKFLREKAKVSYTEEAEVNG
jgi:trigger factor